MKTIETRTCRGCGQDFEVLKWKKKQEFCSSRCRVKSQSNEDDYTSPHGWWMKDSHLYQKRDAKHDYGIREVKYRG